MRRTVMIFTNVNVAPMKTALDALTSLRETGGCPTYRTHLEMIHYGTENFGVNLSEIGTDLEELRELRNKGSLALIKYLSDVLRHAESHKSNAMQEARAALEAELRELLVARDEIADLKLEEIGIQVPDELRTC